MKIKILKIEPGKKPEIKEIEDGLKSLQDEVQGDIEAVYPFDDNVGIICNSVAPTFIMTAAIASFIVDSKKTRPRMRLSISRI